MENATIIKLEPNQQVQSVTTFEEAFGEHSNLHGKGRARRQARKMQRIKNRGERKAARRANRQAKVEDKAIRKQTRQTARLSRKANRKASRGNDDSAMPDDTSASTTDTTAGMQDTSAPISDNGNGTAGPDIDTGAGSSITDAGNGTAGPEIDTGFQDDQQEDDGSTDDGSSGDDGGYDDSGDDGGDTDSFDGYYDNFEDEYASFDGNENKLAANDFYMFESEEGSPVRGRIHPKVKEVARKAEWNKELVSRLQAQFDGCNFDGNEKAGEALSNKIAKHRKRAVELESSLDAYSEAGGKRRTSEVKAARREARKQRMGARKTSENSAASKGTNVTTIEQGLNPQVSDNRIEVPASESSADGYNTGITALDAKNDYDAPQATEIKLGFDSTKAKMALANINWKHVGIGVGIAAALIIGISVFSKRSK